MILPENQLNIKQDDFGFSVRHKIDFPRLNVEINHESTISSQRINFFELQLYIVSNIWWIFISLQNFYINVNKLFIKLQSNFLSSFKLDRATFLVLQWSPFVLLTQSHKNNLLSRQFEFSLFAATNFGFRKILWLKIETTCCRKVFSTSVLCCVWHSV